LDSLYLLIPVVLIFLALAIRILMWAIKSGQYEDLKTEGHRILFEEDRKSHSSTVAPPEGAKQKKRENEPGNE